MIAAFEKGDIAAARREQSLAVQMTDVLASYNYLGASKVVMKMLGVDVGPVRLPNTGPVGEAAAKLQADLEALGFFDWIGAAKPEANAVG